MPVWHVKLADLQKAVGVPDILSSARFFKEFKEIYCSLRTMMILMLNVDRDSL